jgi:hypothetical protein
MPRRASRAVQSSRICCSRLATATNGLSASSTATASIATASPSSSSRSPVDPLSALEPLYAGDSLGRGAGPGPGTDTPSGSLPRMTLEGASRGLALAERLPSGLRLRTTTTPLQRASATLSHRATTGQPARRRTASTR